MRRWAWGLVALMARSVAAQSAAVTGVVHDSIARAPLPGAIVQLVASKAGNAARTATTDSLGRYAFSDVPAGRYMVGFFHPLLDSLGVEPTVREVNVDGRRAARADLAVPSPARLRAAICGKRADSTGVLVGIVRNANDGAPSPDVVVTGEWIEMAFSKSGMVRSTPRLIARTGANGFFAMCSIPVSGAMILRAHRDADSTDAIELQLPANGFARRELYLGGGRQARGARISGVVTRASDGKPLGGAQIRMVDGPQTRANELGEWTLADAPLGTRMLEVHAVSYYPARRAIDVIDGAPPVRVALSTLKAILDTVKTTATRISDKLHGGFETRRQLGFGTYYTYEDVDRLNPISVIEFLRRTNGLALDRAGSMVDTMGVNNRATDTTGLRATDGGTRIWQRGGFAEWCLPAVYLNGHFLNRLTAEAIDDWIKPRELLGIEIYMASTAPAEYQRSDGCGSIVIWSK